MEKRKTTAYRICLAAGILVFIGAFCALFYLTKQAVLTSQQAIIGALYEKDPQICAEIVRQMFEDASPAQTMEKGAQAMISLGYTKQGANYLYDATHLKNVHLLFLTLLCFAGLLLLSPLLLSYRERKAEEKRLIADLRNASLQPEGYSFLKRETFHEMANVLELFKAAKKERDETLLRTQAFLENISHQIKIPLSCISISLDLLLDEVGAAQKEILLEVFPYLDSIQSLLQKLLDLSRLEAGKITLQKTAFPMEQLLIDCACSLPNGKERIAIHAERESHGKILYYGDFEWLREAFLNLLKNCFEHDKSQEKIQITLIETAEGVQIQIRDHGTGILAQDLPFIFDRFYLPKSRKKSHTGIGLNLAKLIIEQHFGSIRAKNHADGGTVFSVTLPIYPLKNSIPVTSL